MEHNKQNQKSKYFLNVCNGYECLSGSLLQLSLVRSGRGNKLVEAGHQAAMEGEANPAENPCVGRMKLEIGWVLAMVELDTGVEYPTFASMLDGLGIVVK